MTDLRRRTPEVPPGLLQIERQTGIAKEMLRKLAPLLAEDGIDINNIEAPDLDTLRLALDRATKRHNEQLFNPEGEVREVALATLWQIVEAICAGDRELAGTLIDGIVPESADDSVATVASCTGICLRLLDEWLGGPESPTPVSPAPAGLAQKIVLPTGYPTGMEAATDILSLAVKNRAFRSLEPLQEGKGGLKTMVGSILAVAAAILAWDQGGGTPRATLIRTAIR